MNIVLYIVNGGDRETNCRAGPGQRKALLFYLIFFCKLSENKTRLYSCNLEQFYLFNCLFVGIKQNYPVKLVKFKNQI